MTRHGSRDGTPEDFGCIYFEMDESNHIRRDLAPDEVKAALDAHMERVGKAAEEPAPEAGWSEWMNWAGGPCPLPGGTQCLCEMRDPDNIPHVRVAESWFWLHEDRGHDIVRFRYATDDPSGWLPRGDDCDAMMFWQQPPEWIAAGVTPDDALRALRAKEKAKP